MSNGTFSERNIYGSSRLGQEQVNMALTQAAPFNYSGMLDNAYGDKRYELSNHLGNVLQVITDRKLPENDGTNHVAHYLADVVSYSDYFPYGMQMPGRNGNDGDGYRYGFQGQEKDNEIKGTGNSVNYKYRMHDPRIGRFFAVDPLEKDYPWNSPYAFSENRVLDAVELEGLEAKLLSTGQYAPTCSANVKRQEAYTGILKDFQSYKSKENWWKSTTVNVFENIIFGDQPMGLQVEDVGLQNYVMSRDINKHTKVYSEEEINGERYLVTTTTHKNASIKYGDVATDGEATVKSVTIVTVTSIAKQKIISGDKSIGYKLSTKNEDFVMMNKPIGKYQEFNGKGDIEKSLNYIRENLGKNEAQNAANDMKTAQGWSKSTNDKLTDALQDAFREVDKSYDPD